jgi:hypothetical protein
MRKPWVGLIAPTRRGQFLTAGLIALLALMLGPASASAHLIEVPVYNGTYPGGSINGADAVGVSSPSFSGEAIQRVEVDQASGSLYVGSEESGGRIYKFNAITGTSAAFSALSGKTVIAPQSMSSIPDISVDNSGTATQGRIYTFPEFGPLKTYLPSGAPDVYPITANGDLCGSTIGPEGHLWLSIFQEGPEQGIREFLPSGEATGKGFRPGGNGEQCDFAMDSEGNFYIPENYTGGFVEKYNSSFEHLYNIGTGGQAEGVAVDRSTDNVYVDESSRVREYSPNGSLLGTFGTAEGVTYPGLQSSRGGIAVDEDTHNVYVANNRSPQTVDRFVPGPPIVAPDVTTGNAVPSPISANLSGIINADGVETTDCHFEWGTSESYGHEENCSEGDSFTGSADNPVSATIGPLAIGTPYHYRLVAANTNGVIVKGVDRVFTAQGTPTIEDQFANNVLSDGAKLNAAIDPHRGSTTYQFEYGLTTGYGATVPALGGLLVSTTAVQSVSQLLHNLVPGAEYHYRVVATDQAGTTTSPDRTFSTFEFVDVPTKEDPCSNALARQQTGASALADCRAYELVSAADAGGYAVESDLITGQKPFGGYPNATDRVLYAVHDGGIPGSGSPTNRGPDPYLAVRGTDGWSTKYIGIPADGGFSTAPFSSTLAEADAGLNTLAFSGPEICAPCFADGSAGIPVHLPDGSLVQGMKGSIPQLSATPAGYVGKRLSADGSHLVFGSSAQFESGGNIGEVSIYDRDLSAGTTQVVSTTPLGETMSGEVGELDISSDGSRILVGEEVSTDAAGNHYWHLFMHLGNSPESVDLMPTASAGALFAGMSGDGSKVFFTTSDSLEAADEDTSADLYEVDISAGGAAAAPKRLSTGATTPVGNVDSCDPVANADGNNWNAVGGASANRCGVVAIGGGGGVASSDGTVYFFSPEALDGSGTLNEPNLFVIRPGQSPHFIATLEPNNSAVRDAVKDGEVHRYGDFQATPSGDFAVFTSSLPLTGYLTGGRGEVFRYDVEGQETACASCAPTNARPFFSGDATLASKGLSVSDDGRVFFTSPEPLALFDSDAKKDVYEWVDGKPQLISSGISPFDSGLLSAGSNGTDAYFFTRDTLAPEDENGTLMKIYDAREKGGFFSIPDPPQCAASDECHGPGSRAAAPAAIGSLAGAEGNLPKATVGKCKAGSVRRHGKCVKRSPRHNRPHRNRRNG